MWPWGQPQRSEAGPSALRQSGGCRRLLRNAPRRPSLAPVRAPRVPYLPAVPGRAVPCRAVLLDVVQCHSHSPVDIMSPLLVPQSASS